MKRLLLLCTLMAAVAASSAMAETTTVRFGDAGSPQQGLGPGYVPFTPGSILVMTPEQRSSFAGGKITKVEFYHGIIRDSKIKTVNMMITDGVNGRPKVQKVMDIPTPGEAELITWELDNPFTITEGTDSLCVTWYLDEVTEWFNGYTNPFVVDRQGSKSEFTSYIAYLENGRWRFDTNNGYYGNTCIWATIETDNPHLNDMSLSGVSMPSETSPAEAFKCGFELRNVGLNDVNQVKVALTINDREPEVSTVDLPQAVKFRGTVNINLQSMVADGGAIHAQVELLEVNGVEDTGATNNHGETYSLCIDKTVPTLERNVLIEEGTSTTCQWCPRGIVGMKTMKETYGPDGRAVLISVHDKDDLALEQYTAFNKAFVYEMPTAVINRVGTIDPRFSNLEAIYKQQMVRPAYAAIAVEAQPIEDGAKISVTSRSQFVFPDMGARYKIAYVLVRDGVGPYWQLNSYAGGEYGEMGGFESMANPCQVYFDDLPVGGTEAMGLEGLLPESLTPGESYVDQMEFDVPEGAKAEELRVVAILINAQNRQVENVAECTPGESGISSIEAAPAAPSIYDLQGRKLSAPVRGINIINGKKVLVK